MAEKCNSVCKARKSLGNHLQAARVYPRSKVNLPFMSKIIDRRARNRAEHVNCYLSKATVYELDEAVKNGEIHSYEVPKVGKMILDRQEAQAIDLAIRRRFTRISCSKPSYKLSQGRINKDDQRPSITKTNPLK